MKAAEIIAQIKELPAEEFEQVYAFLVDKERENLALETAMQRKQESISGLRTSRPYHEAIASARTALAKLDEDRPAYWLSRHRE